MHNSELSLKLFIRFWHLQTHVEIWHLQVLLFLRNGRSCGARLGLAIFLFEVVGVWVVKVLLGGRRHHLCLIAVLHNMFVILHFLIFITSVVLTTTLNLVHDV